MLTITPSMNLVRNIGFGEEATHTVTNYDDQKYKTNNLPKIWIHPKKIVINTKNDEFIFKNHFKGKNYIWPYRFFYLITLFITSPKTFFLKLRNNLSI